MALGTNPPPSSGVWLATQLLMAVVPAICHILDLDLRFTIASCFLVAAVGLYGTTLDRIGKGHGRLEDFVESLKEKVTSENIGKSGDASSPLLDGRELVASKMAAMCVPQQVVSAPRGAPGKNKVFFNNLTKFDGSLLRSSEARPLAEPPAFDYDAFVREKLVPDKKLDVIFAHDPALKTRFRDTQIEAGLLRTYLSWSAEAAALEGNSFRESKFYAGLESEIYIDFKSARDEAWEIKVSFSKLINWEMQWLDDNGGVGNIIAALEQGRDILEASSHQSGTCPPIGFFVDHDTFKKYEYLLRALPHYPKHDIETWEFYQLGDDATLLSQSPFPLDYPMRGSRIIMKSGKPDFVFTVSKIVRGQFDIYERVHEKIEKSFKSDNRLFTSHYFGGEQAKEKYGRIVSSLHRSKPPSRARVGKSTIGIYPSRIYTPGPTND